MILLSCAWVLKAFTQNPCTGFNKYSHSLKTHANPMCNQQKDANALKPRQGGTSDSQNGHANRLKPMHRLAKTKKTAYAKHGGGGEGQLRIRSPSVKEALTLTHSHSFASPARTHGRTKRNDFPVWGELTVPTPPKPPIYIYIYICIY